MKFAWIKMRAFLATLFVSGIMVTSCSDSDFSGGNNERNNASGKNSAGQNQNGNPQNSGQQNGNQDPNGNLNNNAGNQNPNGGVNNKPGVYQGEIDGYLVLLRDTSDSMKNFNKKFGKNEANALTLKSAGIQVITRTCHDDASGAGAPINIINHLLTRATSGTGKYCDASIGTDLKSLVRPTHLMIVIFTDHPPRIITPWASPQAVSSYVASLRNVNTAIKAVSIHGIVSARVLNGETVLASWQKLSPEHGGVFSAGAGSAEQVFTEIAKSVRSKTPPPK